MTTPPEAESAQYFVAKHWNAIQTNKSRNFIPAPTIRMIESFLDRRQLQIEKQGLVIEFDWERDLYLARTFHQHNLDWMEKINSEHQAYISYWKDVCSNALATSEKISLAGLNTIYLVHGAVAVGALNALAMKQAVNGPSISAAAKFAMPAALLGIFLVALGQNRTSPVQRRNGQPYCRKNYRNGIEYQI